MRIARPFTLFVLVLATALGTQAARADGLTRFQDLLAAKGKADMIRFSSGASLGTNGFVLENVVVTPPPDMVEPGKMPVTPLPTRIARVSVEDIDLDSIAKDKPPLFLRARLEGIALDGKATPGGEMRKYLGTDSALLDASIDYRLDGANQTLTLQRLEVELRGFARIELAVAIDGVSPDVADAPQQAAGTASLRSASLVIYDASLLARIVRGAATEQGQSPDAMVDLLVKTILMTVDGEGPLTRTAGHTVGAFLRDWQRTRGPLRIALAPTAKLTFADLTGLGKADDVAKALGLSVTYDGTSVTPPPLPDKLTGGAAIERLIGNTFAGNVDGQEVTEYLQPDGTWVSRIDNVLSRGRWRRNDDQVCFKLPDDDENCYRVEIVGRRVTMLDEQDEKEEFELFDGNAKDL